MISVKTVKGKTCNPKKQDTSVLPTSINVGVLSFLYLLVAIFILKVMDFVHTVNSGYHPIKLEEKPVTNILFFNPPTILFIILLTVVFGFVFTWGGQNTETENSIYYCRRLTPTHPAFCVSNHPIVKHDKRL